MDPRRIVSQKLSRSQIWEEAEAFRSGHIFTTDLPIDIELVTDATLDIRIIPIESLQSHCDMDGFISKDFKYIYVDKSLYTIDHYYRRVRFTIAHELGHYMLHRSIIDHQKFKDEDDWIRFRMGIPETSLGWFEMQANEFAGRLLVPLDPLIEDFRLRRQDVLRKNSGFNSIKISDDELFSIVAPQICPRFGVSAEVIERRLIKENIMALIGH